MFRFSKQKESKMLTIYGVPVSVHTRKVIVTALIKKIAYKLEPVVPFQPPPNWSALSPTGLIPVIEDDGFRLADSTAICQYLERTRPEPHILPKDHREAAQALALDAYAGGMLFQNVVRPLFFQHVIRPAILKEQTDRGVVENVMTNVQPKIFAYLDGEAKTPPLSADNLTIGALAVASNLINYQYLGYAIDGSRYPNLASFVRRAVAHRVMQTALAAEKPFAEQMGLDRALLG